MQKFLFEHSFEPEALAKEQQLKSAPSFTQDQIDTEKRIAKDKGYQDGYSQAYTEIEEKISKTLSGIASKAAQLMSTEQAARDQIHADTIVLSSYILHKIIPSLLEHFGEGEILEFISGTLSGLKEKGELEIYVHPSLHKNLRGKLQAIMSDDSIALKEDGNLSVLDCRIQWKNGGRERLCSAFIQNIDATLEAFLINLKELYAQGSNTKKNILEIKDE